MTQKIKKENQIKSAHIRMLVSAGLLLLSAALLVYASAVPSFAQWYSGHFYPKLVMSIGRVSGFVPFSVSEVLICLLLAALFVSFVFLAGNIITAPGGRERIRFFYRWLSFVLTAASVLFTLYTVCCGINYHRKSFSEEEGIVTESYTAEDLKQICIWLTEEVGQLCQSVSRDQDGVMRLDAPEEEGAVEAMYALAESFPSLEGYYPRPKELIFSQVLSYQGLTGIYLPFTVEANYNGDMTPYNIPFTACHELSHLRGFMQEQEANFIGFLACISSERTDFQYSGYLSGWIYCMNALYRADYEKWAQVRILLTPEAEADLTANSEFWDSYEGPVSETATRINDTYLKANGQEDGVESYDRMVDLIVAYFGNQTE